MAELVTERFFGADSLARTLCVLCDNSKHAHDPIASTVQTMLNSPLHFQLTAVGWQPFRGKDLTFPYLMMTAPQREALRGLLDGGCKVYEHALVAKGQAPRLQTLEVLVTLCGMILESSAYSDRRLRVAICNILLQRVQASVPIDKGTQAALNARVFGQA